MSDWDILQIFWDFKPSWQNSIDSINRKLGHLTFIGLYTENELAGYAIIEDNTGDIPQLAIYGKLRGKCFATELIKHLIGISKSSEIKIINSVASYEPFRKFAENVNFKPGFGQFEMLIKL